MRKKKGGKPQPTARRARATRGRQRQHLIDACISALHIYGPSRTTVEKVVAIADMSPGIVRFYFDSKAAMLVASLKFLSGEFEERVLLPVARLKDAPVAALELLVDLYLDPHIASARKVSVWYSFWGEASSRQEYYDICGQKDERFAALLRELIERLIVETGQAQLDPDGIALGLIGVLEMLWQGFAFQSETAIDRAAAKHRAMAYLRSIFPGRFALNRAAAGDGEPGRPSGSLPGWSYDDARLAAIERETLFRGSWQCVGHESQVQAPGDYLAVDLCAERALVVRDASGALRALRNSCPVQPHGLVRESSGSFVGGVIACRAHGLRFALDGTALDGNAAMQPLELAVVRGIIFARGGSARTGAAAPSAWIAAADAPTVAPIGAPAEWRVAADWKLMVEQCLDMSMPARIDEASGQAWSSVALTINAAAELDWIAEVDAATDLWSARRYRTLLGADGFVPWRRTFIPPNQFAEIRPDGITLMRVLPLEAGGCRVLRQAYSRFASDRRGLAAAYLADRLLCCLRRDAVALIESIQRGLVGFGYEASRAQRSSGAADAFRTWIRQRIPALALAKAPADWRPLV